MCSQQQNYSREENEALIMADNKKSASTDILDTQFVYSYGGQWENPTEMLK